MLIYEIEELLKTKPITQIQLRVAVYVRVSTETEAQMTSAINQTDYYRNMVLANPNWVLTEIYADEGISGMSVKKRDAFNRMVSDAKDGKFDMIITKMVSRFARNTLDAIRFARELKGHNVGIWFEQDGINTFDKDSEFKLTIMAAMAQNESEKKSVAVKFGLHQSIKKGVVFGFDNMWGMRKKDGKLVIDEKEAPMVRTLFELYVTDKYSLKQIEDVLWDMGFRNRRGGKIKHVTLSNIIRNPKYKGYYVGNKVLQTDIFDRKFILLPEKDWVMFKAPDIVPEIIDEETWDRANEILARRSKDVKNRQNLCNRPNLMTGKIRCVHCDRLYHRKDSGYARKNVVSTWICAGKVQNGAATCPARYLYEDEIKHILFSVLQETSQEFDFYMRRYEEMLTKLLEGDDTAKRQEAIGKEIERLNRKKIKLLGYNADGEISDEDFLMMKSDIDEERNKLEKELMQLREAVASKQVMHERLKEIKHAIASISSVQQEEAIDDVFVRNYIDIIDVEVIDKTPHLTIKLKTGKVIEKDINCLRTGKRSNLIIPGRRFIFDRQDIIGRSLHKLECFAEVQVI